MQRFNAERSALRAALREACAMVRNGYISERLAEIEKLAERGNG